MSSKGLIPTRTYDLSRPSLNLPSLRQPTQGEGSSHIRFGQPTLRPTPRPSDKACRRGTGTGETSPVVVETGKDEDPDLYGRVGTVPRDSLVDAHVPDPVHDVEWTYDLRTGGELVCSGRKGCRLGVPFPLGYGRESREPPPSFVGRPLSVPEGLPPSQKPEPRIYPKVGHLSHRIRSITLLPFWVTDSLALSLIYFPVE